MCVKSESESKIYHQYHNIYIIWNHFFRIYLLSRHHYNMENIRIYLPAFHIGDIGIHIYFMADINWGLYSLLEIYIFLSVYRSFLLHGDMLKFTAHLGFLFPYKSFKKYVLAHTIFKLKCSIPEIFSIWYFKLKMLLD